MVDFVPSNTPSPDHHPDLQDPKVVVDIFNQATKANLESTLRQGSTLCLPPRGSLLITGDLHDHGPNLQKILQIAALNKKNHHLILHEVIHGPHLVNGCDLSVRTLACVAALKVQFPNQVHPLQSNHELAQLTGEGILKAGVSVVETFNQGVKFIYADAAHWVQDALHHYLRSLPLAVKCPNGLFISHSLPSPRFLNRFDPTVIDRLPTDQDLMSGGYVHQMVWGRRHTPKSTEVLAEAWGVEQFITGHQPAEMGYETQGDSILILASDHGHGVALPIRLSKTYDQAGLIDQIIPLASIPL